ncbi:MAG: glycoside hydrolase family 1 protein [Culicoidibacterales bacterium]
MAKINVKIPNKFIIGAASSAWQTEGWSEKKQGQDSYIDMWYKECKHVWHNGYGPAIATDFYHKYPQDIAAMKQIGLTHFRSSINWSRFLTDYENIVVDEEYAAYIDDVIDGIIASGVEPMFCLEHYEIPRVLFEKYGAWNDKYVVELFVKYAEEVFKRYGSKVKTWFVFNEPSVVQTRVYLDAIRYPFYQDTQIWMQWNFNKALATAKVIAVFHKGKYGAKNNAKIGTVLNPEQTYARSSAAHDQYAAKMYDLFHNKMYLDPAILGYFPPEIFALMDDHKIAFNYTQEELEIIKENPVDIIGINLYYPKRVQAKQTMWNPNTPFHPAYYYDNFDLPGKKMNPHRGWEIYPQIVYDMAMRLKNEYGNLPWILTENGMGIENEQQYRNVEGFIEDDYRIEFISEHLHQLILAVEEGANCRGYMLWSFTDTVSPMNAFKNRYGLVEIDLENNRARKIKKSGYWYQEIIASREFEVDDNNDEK